MLGRVDKGTSMHPIHLDLGFRVFHYYEGLYFFLAILVAAVVAVRRLKRAGLDAARFLDNLVWILLGAFLGARISHFVFWEPATLRENPLSFFWFWEGGMSITGGLAGGFIAAWVCFRRVGYARIFAAASPAVLLGQAIGRVGCFLNGDAWGTPTNLPWGVAMPKFGTWLPAFRPDTQFPSDAWLWSVTQGFTDPSSLRTVPLHPVQLYEAAGDLLLAGLVILLGRRLARTNGPWARAGWLHVGGYALLRFGLEFLHGDRDAIVAAGMTNLQLGLLVCVVLASILFVTLSTPSEG